MKSKNSITDSKITYNTIIEVNDESNDFIPYWDLAMTEHISNNYITVGRVPNKTKVKSLYSFYIKLINKKEEFSPEKSDYIQLDKLFTIDVYRIKKEKEFNKDFIKNYQINHNPNNLNVFLYNINEVKDSTIKNLNKISEKLKYKLGLTDFSFVPYNKNNYDKFYSIIDDFFGVLKERISIEYNNQMGLLLNSIKNMNDIYNNEEEIIYEYIKNKVLYLDLLAMGDFSEEIKKTCNSDIFKVFDKLSNKYIYANHPSLNDLNIMEIKQKIKNKNLTNIDYQLFLLYNYIKSCRLLKEY